jgi:hypothetical protein
MGFGYRESLEGRFWPQIWIENNKKSEGGSGIEGSDRTFLDKKELPLGFMRAKQKNSKFPFLKQRELARSAWERGEFCRTVHSGGTGLRHGSGMRGG